MEYYSAIKNTETISFVGKWVELEVTMLSETSHMQKEKYHMLCLICGNKGRKDLKVVEGHLGGGKGMGDWQGERGG